MITIYTDGACSGNPGPGGYGVVLRSGQHYKELSAGFYKTTNNRMELMAVIEGLAALKKPAQKVMVYSDSKYVVESIEKGWLWNWQMKDFAGKKNADLWKRLIPLYRSHQVKLNWVKGHAGNPDNERCDRLAVAAAQNPTAADDGFEDA